MKSWKSVAYLSIGGILVLNFLVMIWVSNLNLGLIGTLLLGIYFLAWGCFRTSLSRIRYGSFWKGFHYVVLAGILFLVGMSVCLGIYGNRDTVDYTEDAIIVLGAAVQGERVSLPLKYRLDATAEYATKNPDAVIVASGGQGAQESVTEAFAMERYLKQKGVSNLILKEEKATSTSENFLFSKNILDAHFDGAYEVAFVTNGFHIYRAGQMAKDTGFAGITHLHAKIAWYNVMQNYLRESLAVLKYWILG